MTFWGNTSLRIHLVTPARKGARAGNWVTANRLRGILRQLGHRVQVSNRYEREAADLLLAIHAWRSAEAIERFKSAHPDRPLVVLLAGTDVYRFQHSHAEATLASMQLADRLVGLHDCIGEDIPERFGAKLSVIHQSFRAPNARHAPLSRWFQLCVVGHLRAEKDPFCAARAARLVNPDSRLRIIHLGGAPEARWADAARKEMARNPRYVWLGERNRTQVRYAYRRSHAMVMSSVMEGGANAVSEAMVSDLPVLASDISGNRGLLGPEHPAYYPAEDHAALKALIERAEQDPRLLRRCVANSRRRKKVFTPAAELEAWRELLARLS